MAITISITEKPLLYERREFFLKFPEGSLDWGDE